MGFAGTLASGWTDWIIADVSFFLSFSKEPVESTIDSLLLHSPLFVLPGWSRGKDGGGDIT
jgi:hypothetical protein